MLESVTAPTAALSAVSKTLEPIFPGSVSATASRAAIKTTLRPDLPGTVW